MMTTFHSNEDAIDLVLQTFEGSKVEYITTDGFWKLSELDKYNGVWLKVDCPKCKQTTFIVWVSGEPISFYCRNEKCRAEFKYSFTPKEKKKADREGREPTYLLYYKLKERKFKIIDVERINE